MPQFQVVSVSFFFQRLPGNQLLVKTKESRFLLPSFVTERQGQKRCKYRENLKDFSDVFKNMTSEIFQTGLDQFGADLSCIQPREPVCSLSKKH